jgi:hypothetical protein
MRPPSAWIWVPAPDPHGLAIEGRPKVALFPFRLFVSDSHRERLGCTGLGMDSPGTRHCGCVPERRLLTNDTL